MPARRSASTSASADATASEPAATAAESEFTFEQAFQRLEDLVESMESEDLPLEQLLTSHEEGTRLLQRCQQLLAAAEERVAQIELTDPGSATAPSTPPANSASASPQAASRPAPDSADDISLF